jgi:hypothetical protein
VSQVFVSLSSNFAQIILLVFLSLCVGHLWAATCQPGGAGASADPATRPPAIPDVGAQTTSRETPDNKSKNDTFILTEVEPLRLLLFGSILFAVATGIKLKLSRVNRARASASNHQSHRLPAGLRRIRNRYVSYKKR